MKPSRVPHASFRLAFFAVRVLLLAAIFRAGFSAFSGRLMLCTLALTASIRLMTLGAASSRGAIYSIRSLPPAHVKSCERPLDKGEKEESA